MPLKDGRLGGIPFQQAHYIGGPITPDLVIVHDTAGRLEAGNSAAYLRGRNAAKASVHFVVERDGSIEQQVPVHQRANHAGRSRYHGREGCNAFSLGIEIVNPGKMQRAAEGVARAWWGQTFSVSEYDIQWVETREHGAGYWMAYPEAQIVAVQALLAQLFDQVETLADIQPHWFVSPGRKVDTNPLFPLEHLRARILGRDDPTDAAAERGSEPVDGAFVVVDLDPSGVNLHSESLNMRRWPSFNPNVIGQIPDGTVVPVLRRGIFEGREWLCVFYSGQEGWIVSRYAAPIIAKGAPT